MIATETLVLVFTVFKSQTINMGRIPSVQSAMAERALCAYVDPAMIGLLTHLPFEDG